MLSSRLSNAGIQDIHLWLGPKNGWYPYFFFLYEEWANTIMFSKILLNVKFTQELIAIIDKILKSFLLPITQ